MAKKQPYRQRQCEICLAFVKSPSNLAKHCLKTGHQDDQCCQQCVKWFGSKESLAQHKAAKHGEPRAVMLSQNLPSVPDPGPDTLSSPVLGSYTFRDGESKRLSPHDMNVVFDLLLVTCHSQDRLRREGYVLPDDLNKEPRSGKKQAKILKQCLPTPVCDPFSPKRKAVAFDCEMAGVEGGRSEVVSICAVDVFTGEVLTNSLVKPREPILEWRSHINGVTPSIMSIAAARRQVLDGWEAARGELWKHVNEDTVLVGQSLQHDLKALRVVHTKVVDTAIVSVEAAFGKGKSIGRRWGLELLCEELLHLRIRQGSGVHNELEDTMAARELALWCLCHPVELQQWGERARKSFYSERVRNRKRCPRLAAKAPRTARNDNGGKEGYIQQYCSRDDKILRWEDVIDWEPVLLRARVLGPQFWLFGEVVEIDGHLSSKRLPAADTTQLGHEAADLECNGVDFFVTSNLYSALVHLRNTDSDISLWIDAICIDQKTIGRKKARFRGWATSIAARKDGEVLRRQSVGKRAVASKRRPTPPKSAIPKRVETPWALDSELILYRTRLWVPIQRSSWHAEHQIINSLLAPTFHDLVDSVIVTIAPTWLGQGGVVVSPDRVQDSVGVPIPAARLSDASWQLDFQTS
ncbi:RNA exonuclease 3 [Zalerion maritima]|uniref:RNA exonuclease 3 n=1 Tax=Zalerion maritima TaxID=339359 RepID=A0AAD5RM26_9PEZI|nr:RNA exonuclease 3 [Zalerion maritima]